MKIVFWIIFLILINLHFVFANEIDLSISPKKVEGKMGDIIHFKSLLKNNSDTVEGLVVYISLVKITKGLEAPMDLEDWNAQKAVTIPTLKIAESRTSDWTLRLIDSGNYVVYITAVDKNKLTPLVSEMANLVITKKQSLNPNNVIPIALGVPLLITGFFLGISRSRNML